MASVERSLLRSVLNWGGASQLEAATRLLVWMRKFACNTNALSGGWGCGFACNLTLFDEALVAIGLERDVVTIVSGFATSVALARGSDLIASVPDRHTLGLRGGMHSFPLPVAVPEFTISLLWHPRMDADPAHSWLRGCVRAVCV
jgi:DNA-binding transcriptional LysR family regulator